MTHWPHQTLFPFVGAGMIRALGRSMSWRVRGFEHVDRLYRQGRRMIIAFWHGQQLMMPLAYRGHDVRILISRHRDGELVCRIVRRFGLGAIRGSTTRGGAGALRQLIRAGRQGADLVITPDGPTGPRHVVQPGVLALARATGMPIVPLTFACSKKKLLRVGIGLSSRTRFRAGCFCGGPRSGLTAPPARRPWNACGAKSRRPWRPSRLTPRRWCHVRRDGTMGAARVCPCPCHGRVR